MAEKAGKDEEMEKRITMIDTGEIMEHPNNPRKDLGDLTELAESVKLHGIMQNLIVINREEAVAGLLKEYEQTPSQIYAETLDKLRDRKAKYIVLLGHRRLAAAGEAGLDEVPCIVESGMTLNDQISLMLLENMQRKGHICQREGSAYIRTRRRGEGRRMVVNHGRGTREVAGEIPAGADGNADAAAYR